MWEPLVADADFLLLVVHLAGKGIAHAVLLAPEELTALEEVGNDGSVVFLDAKGDLVTPNPLIELEGKTLRETWMLGREDMEAWEAEALK